LSLLDCYAVKITNINATKMPTTKLITQRQNIASQETLQHYIVSLTSLKVGPHKKYGLNTKQRVQSTSLQQFFRL